MLALWWKGGETAGSSVRTLWTREAPVPILKFWKMSAKHTLNLCVFQLSHHLWDEKNTGHPPHKGVERDGEEGSTLNLSEGSFYRRTKPYITDTLFTQTLKHQCVFRGEDNILVWQWVFLFIKIIAAAIPSLSTLDAIHTQPWRLLTPHLRSWCGVSETLFWLVCYVLHVFPPPLSWSAARKQPSAKSRAECFSRLFATSYAVATFEAGQN